MDGTTSASEHLDQRRTPYSRPIPCNSCRHHKKKCVFEQFSSTCNNCHRRNQNCGGRQPTDNAKAFRARRRRLRGEEDPQLLQALGLSNRTTPSSSNDSFPVVLATSAGMTDYPQQSTGSVVSHASTITMFSALSTTPQQSAPFLPSFRTSATAFPCQQGYYDNPISSAGNIQNFVPRPAMHHGQDSRPSLQTMDPGAFSRQH